MLLLTGLNGFLGSALSSRLEKEGNFKIRYIVRKLSGISSSNIIAVGDINGTTTFPGVFDEVSVIIHAAARVHVMSEDSSDSLNEYRKVNVEGTKNLALQAAAAGVRRFIFISSIKVNGESTTRSVPYVETNTPAPEDHYGQSKFEAEEALKKISDESGMEIVIIRPPLIYGLGVKANFLRLMKLAITPFPLPFGLVGNHRSMVYVGNLVDFIIQCIDHPKAVNQTFLISDGEDLSLKSLVTHIRSSIGRSANLLPVPFFLFKTLGILTGKRDVIDRMVGDLQVNSSKARTLLDWVPPYTVEEGITATVTDFMNRK
jgi:UDP-glucose 4-epimerase